MFDHHELTDLAYRFHIEKWSESISTNRCPDCWLRKYECFCYSIKENIDLSPPIGKVIIYYHFKELGRSCNTAHLLPLI